MPRFTRDADDQRRLLVAHMRPLANHPPDLQQLVFRHMMVGLGGTHENVGEARDEPGPFGTVCFERLLDAVQLVVGNIRFSAGEPQPFQKRHKNGNGTIFHFMISLTRINKQYGRQILFVDASFQLNPGEKVGLVGPNGAGKTTLFRMITGEE